jgi:hypothetical protein
MDPDTREPVADQSRRYVVAMPREKVPKLRRILREAARVFEQKCIYLSVAGRVELLTGTRDENS